MRSTSSPINAALAFSSDFLIAVLIITVSAKSEASLTQNSWFVPTAGERREISHDLFLSLERKFL